MNQDALIGQLYRELSDAKEANDVLIAIVTGLKTGTLPDERVTLNEDGSITLEPAPESEYDEVAV